MKQIDSPHADQERPGTRTEGRALDEPAVYELRVAQRVSGRWAAWFDDLDLAYDDEGNTLLRGTIVDQAALHGLLTRIRDLNLILLSVTRK